MNQAVSLHSSDEVNAESLKLQLASKLWTYLQLEDMGRCTCVCTSWHFDFGKNEFRKLVIRQSGIGSKFRPGFWASSLHVSKVQHKIITRGDAANARTPNMYYIEFVQHDPSSRECIDKDEENRPSIGTASLNKTGREGEILRDVSRTFPSASLFKDDGRGQDMLANVLKACLRAEPGVGYCQGMNFVAATLLRACVEARKTDHANQGAAQEDWVNSDDMRAEADTFWLMMAIMDSEKKMDMTGMWSNGVPALRLRCFQFESLLKVHIPKLHAHLHAIGLASEVLASQWFLTLFAYALPFEDTVRCWDEVFLDGWTQILKVAIGHLKECEDKLIPLTLEDTSRFLRSWKFSKDIFSRALQVAQTIEVTPAMVEQLQVEYGVTQLRRRLAVTGPSWMQRYGDPLEDIEDGGNRDNILDSLMKELMELEGLGRSDAANLRKRIEIAHASVASARIKLTKTETSLAKASGELGAAKQAKITIAKAARDTIANIQPGAMMRASSSPEKGAKLVGVRSKGQGLQDGALAPVNFRSLSAPAEAVSNESIPTEVTVTKETVSKTVTSSELAECEQSEVKRDLPRRPQRPPPTPPPAMLVPFPSLEKPDPAPIEQGLEKGEGSISPLASTPRSTPSPSSGSPSVSGLALMVEDFLFGRDLVTTSESGRSSEGASIDTKKKNRSDSFNTSLKLPSLSFNMDMSPLQTIAYAVGSPNGAVGSEQRLMADLRAQQKAALSAERKVVSARSRYATCLRKFKVAQADLEDAVDFKKRLSQQLLHILTMSEDEQFSKMLSMSSIFDTNATPDAVTVTLVESEEYSV